MKKISFLEAVSFIQHNTEPVAWADLTESLHVPAVLLNELKQPFVIVMKPFTPNEAKQAALDSFGGVAFNDDDKFYLSSKGFIKILSEDDGPAFIYPSMQSASLYN